MLPLTTDISHCRQSSHLQPTGFDVQCCKNFCCHGNRCWLAIANADFADRSWWWMPNLFLKKVKKINWCQNLFDLCVICSPHSVCSWSKLLRTMLIRDWSSRWQIPLLCKSRGLQSRLQFQEVKYMREYRHTKQPYSVINGDALDYLFFLLVFDCSYVRRIGLTIQIFSLPNSSIEFSSFNCFCL